MSDEAECAEYSARTGKVLKVGDTLCNTCRLIRYDTSIPWDESYELSTHESSRSPTPPQDDSSQQTSSVSCSQSPTVSCSQSSTDDPSFVFQESMSAELIELPFSRVVATHKYCFICNSSSSLVSVSAQARLQALQKKKIFIPKGNRCCSDHLIKGKFYAEDLEALKIHASRSMIGESDFKFLIENL